MRFKSRSPQNITTVMQRRLIALVGGLGACLILLQLLAQGRVPALLTGDAADPLAATRHLNLKPDLSDDESEQSPSLVRVASAQEAKSEANDGLAIDAELLEVIKDNSVGIRDSERDLYFMLLRRLQTESEEAVNRAAQSISFNVLMTDSKKYCGQLLRVKGEARRIVPLPPQADRNLPQLYEVWLFTADSALNPYRIVCSSLPEGMPTGDDLKTAPKVQVVGYYFKRYGYATADGRLHVAPLVLSKTLQWQRTTPRSPHVNPTSSIIITGIVGLLSLLAIVWWRMRAGDREFERRFLKPNRLV